MSALSGADSRFRAMLALANIDLADLANMDGPRLQQMIDEIAREGGFSGGGGVGPPGTSDPIEVNVKRFGVGTDKTETQNNAGLTDLFGEHPAGVILGFPDEGTYNVTLTTPERNNLGYRGRGLGTIVNWTANDAFHPAGTMSGFKARDIRLQASATAGHLFNLDAGGMIFSSFTDAELKALNPSKSILRQNNGNNFFGNVFENVKWERTLNHTVPGIDIITDSSGANTNRFNGGWMHSKMCATTPFLRVEITSASVYANKWAFRGVVGEQNKAGWMHFYSGNGVLIEDCVDHDQTDTYVDDLFKMSNTTGATGRGLRFYNSGSSSIGVFDAGKAHLKIEGSGGYHDIGRIVNGGVVGTCIIPNAGRTMRHGGGYAHSVATVTNNYSALANDDIIIMNSATPRTVTLPDPTALLSSGTVPNGREYKVINIGTGETTVLVAGGTTINGAASVALSQWANGEFLLIGSNWVRG